MGWAVVMVESAPDCYVGITSFYGKIKIKQNKKKQKLATHEQGLRQILQCSCLFC
jgi:predicted FMN-binding regulatory protein PaiB